MDHLTKLNIDIPDVKLPDFKTSGGGWPLVVDHVESWAWHDSVFTNSELDTIIEIGTKTELVKATTFGSQDDGVRNSYVNFLYPSPLTNWIFERLSGVVHNLNAQFFKFDLHGFDQGLQFTRYEAPGQHYQWHKDSGYNTAVRKLSVSVQLTDPKEYKGGDLQLKLAQTDITIPKKRGMVAVFPSYTVHRVKPVTQGTRYSLVAWISGPPFK